MLSKTCIFAITVLLIIATVPVAAAQSPTPAAPSGPVMRPPAPKTPANIIIPFRCPTQSLRIPSRGLLTSFDSQLALTAEQHQKIQALLDKSRDSTSKLLDQQLAATGDMVKAVAAPKPDKATVEKAAAAATKAESALLSAQLSFWMDVKEILTPAQNEQLRDMMLRFGGTTIPPTNLPRPGMPLPGSAPAAGQGEKP